MSSQQTQVIQNQPQKSRGGILRTLLRPFMPEVATGLDVASGLLKGDPSAALTQASKMMSGDEQAGGEEEAPSREGTVTPGEIPDVNPIAPPEAGQEMAMEDPQAQGEDFTPEQLQSLNMIAQQFPTWNQDLQQEPELLDGAGALISKLSSFYKRQRPQGQQMA